MKDYGKQQHEHVIAWVVWELYKTRGLNNKRLRVSKAWVRSWYGLIGSVLGMD